MEYFISVLAVAAFGYFIFTRVKASNKRKAEREANPPAPPVRDEDLPDYRDPRVKHR